MRAGKCVCVCARKSASGGEDKLEAYKKSRRIGVLNPSSVGHSGGVLRQTDLDLNSFREQKLPVHKRRGGIDVKRHAGRVCVCNFGLKVIIQIVPPN